MFIASKTLLAGKPAALAAARAFSTTKATAAKVRVSQSQPMRVDFIIQYSIALALASIRLGGAVGHMMAWRPRVCCPTHPPPQSNPPQQVAVVGASGGIGQPLSMLLKLDKGVTELSLYDIVHTPGVAADLSHIPTKGKVAGHKGACVGSCGLMGWFLG